MPCAEEEDLDYADMSMADLKDPIVGKEATILDERGQGARATSKGRDKWKGTLTHAVARSAVAVKRL